MQVTISPLKENNRVNAGDWYEKTLESQYSGVGSGSYSLPYEDDDRVALIYQLFLFMSDEEKNFSLPTFSMAVFGRSRYQEMTDIFNQEIVLKFTREVSYRLEEILEDLGDKKEVPREAMNIFHHHDHSMNITSSNIEGSNIASGGSTVSNSSAQSNKQVNQAELLEALQQARESAQALPEKERKKAEVFIDSIEEEAQSGQEMSPTALHFAACLYPLLERVGNAAEAIEKIKHFFN